MLADPVLVCADSVLVLDPVLELADPALVLADPVLELADPALVLADPMLVLTDPVPALADPDPVPLLLCCSKPASVIPVSALFRELESLSANAALTHSDKVASSERSKVGAGLRITSFTTVKVDKHPSRFARVQKGIFA